MKDDYYIRKLIRDPLSFTIVNYEKLYDRILNGQIPPSILRQTTLRILDLTDSGVFNSNADKGFTGFLNKNSRSKRHERFHRLMKNGFKQRENTYTILAEGDSWFEHPMIMDILDNLELYDDVAIFSLAYGADWLDNILYEGEYIDQLSLLKPDVFLVSGGGNDIIEGGKLSLFLCNIETSQSKIKIEDVIQRFPSVSDWAPEEKKALQLLNPEFYSFLHLMLFQYYYMFRSIRRKYVNMPIITQGYDYAIPHSLIKRPWYDFYQKGINYFQGSGKWIETTMKRSSISEVYTMHTILKAMLGLFNEGLKELATIGKVDYLYHIDNRSIADYNHWFDEIHLRGKKAFQVAATYHNAIDKAIRFPEKTEKVFIAKDIWKGQDKSPINFHSLLKGFIRIAPTWKTLVLQLVVVIILLLLWWILLPNQSFNKLPITLTVLGLPIVVYSYKILRAVWLSWYYSFPGSENNGLDFHTLLSSNYDDILDFDMRHSKGNKHYTDEDIALIKKCLASGLSQGVYQEGKLIGYRLSTILNGSESPVEEVVTNYCNSQTSLLYGTHIHTKYRSMGLGKILTLRHLDYLKSKGIFEVFVTVDSENFPSKRMLNYCGFEKIQDIICYGQNRELLKIVLNKN